MSDEISGANLSSSGAVDFLELKRRENSLGEILVRMGAVTRVQLYDVLLVLSCMNACGTFGRLLIEKGLVTQEQIDIASAAQRGIEGGNNAEYALASVDIACERKRYLARDVEKLNERGQEIVRRSNGAGYPAVSGDE